MLRTYPDSDRAADALYMDGIAASYGQPDVLVWVRGRLEAKDPDRLKKLDRKSKRIQRKVARKSDEAIEPKTELAPAPVAAPPEETVPNDPSGNPADTTIPTGAPPTATEPEPAPEPAPSGEPTGGPASAPEPSDPSTDPPR